MVVAVSQQVQLSTGLHPVHGMLWRRGAAEHVADTMQHNACVLLPLLAITMRHVSECSRRKHGQCTAPIAAIEQQCI